MNCPTCRVDNPVNSRFCLECGASFASPCPKCGIELPPAAKFCNACGHALRPASLRPPASSLGAPSPLSYTPEHLADPSIRTLAGTTQDERLSDPLAYTPRHLAEKILNSRSALEGERKQVTVLFADVKGSMELAEQVDPEEWHRIMDRFFAILSDGVHRFEGTVNQYTGDGIMALFGAPIAHEDHAQRACYAALHLMDELRRYADELRLNQGLNFAVRMGLNSGEVVVGRIGDDLRMDYTAQGHTVGLAARMEQIAEPRSIYLTGQTAKLVEGFFRLRDLGPAQVKGVGDKVQVWELEGLGALRTRFELSRARGLSRFVGRRDETAALEAGLERAIEGNGQVFGVVGEAGVGKSRLCFEFAERCRSRGLTIYEAHGVAHGKVVPLLPVLDLLRAVFGISDQDADRTARDKIAGRTLLLDESLKDAVPLLFDFLGVPDPDRPGPRLDPEVRQRQLFEVMRRLTRARSQHEAAIFLLEDLHWIDSASEAFLDNLVEAVRGTRTLLLVNFRPEYHVVWMQKSYYQQLPLLPLGPEGAGELLRDLLGTDSAMTSLADRIQAHTGGNPFFLEEVVRTLAEAGCLEGPKGAYHLARPVDELTIPDTVEAVLAARIDRLAEREKQVLQAASIIGRQLAEPVLKRVVELPNGELADALRTLIAAEFLYEEALYPEAEYAFTHALTQEVAYHSQLGEHRRRMHAAVARAIEVQDAERADEHAALLAHHWEEAGDPLLAAHWHHRAAAWAGMAHADEALRHWRKVRELLDSVPESPETIANGLGARVAIANIALRARRLDEDVAKLFAEMRDLVGRSADPGARLQFLGIYGLYRMYRESVREGVEALRDAKRLADDLRHAETRVTLRAALLIGFLAGGPLSEGLANADELVDFLKIDPNLGAEVLGYHPHPTVLAFRALHLANLGRLTEAAEGVGRAFQLARQYDDPLALATCEYAQVRLEVLKGDGATACARARRAAAVVERVGHANIIAGTYAALGSACVLEEQWAEAVEALERCRGVSSGLSGLEGGPHLALALLGLGEHDRARSVAEETVSLTRRYGARILEVHNQLALAHVLVKAEGAKAQLAAEHALSRAAALVEETEFRAMEPQIHVERAELARVLGSEATRRQELREAHRLFAEMGATGHAERLAKVLEGVGVPKRKSVAHKPKAKAKAKGAKPGKRAKPKPVRQVARRKSKK